MVKSKPQALTNNWISAVICTIMIMTMWMTTGNTFSKTMIIITTSPEKYWYQSGRPTIRIWFSSEITIPNHLNRRLSNQLSHPRQGPMKKITFCKPMIATIVGRHWGNNFYKTTIKKTTTCLSSATATFRHHRPLSRTSRLSSNHIIIWSKLKLLSKQRIKQR